MQFKMSHSLTFLPCLFPSLTMFFARSARGFVTNLTPAAREARGRGFEGSKVQWRMAAAVTDGPEINQPKYMYQYRCLDLLDGF